MKKFNGLTKKKKATVAAALGVVLVTVIVVIIAVSVNNSNALKAKEAENTTVTKVEATTEPTTEAPTTEEPTTEESTTEPSATEKQTTKRPVQTTKPKSDTQTTTKKKTETNTTEDYFSGGPGVANPDTGISYDGGPIVYKYTDGTTGTVPKNMAEYEYEPGVWCIYIAPEAIESAIAEADARGGRCPECGRKDCIAYSFDWHCDICDKDIPAYQCHHH